MSESKFIKTTTFGGYDKADADAYFEKLCDAIFNLQNELDKAKSLYSLIEEKKIDPHEALKTTIDQQAKKLSDAQKQNKMLEKDVENLKEENDAKAKEIDQLKTKIKKFEDKLADAELTISGYKSGDETAAFGVVFVEAKKTAGKLVEEARKEASEVEEDSRKLAENMIKEANNKAAKIIYDAEKKAAEVEAMSKEENQNLTISTQNIKAVALKDIDIIDENFKEVVSSLESVIKLIDMSRQELVKGEIPHIEHLVNIDPNLPPIPEFEQIDNNYMYGNEKAKEEKEKAQQELEKMMAKAKTIATGGIDLNTLSQQANSLIDDKPKQQQAKKPKDGAVDLADLLKQADKLAFEGEKPEKEKSSQSIDLNALAAQAEALNKK